ncbi:MAG: hypothetical protein K8S98_03240 [Planctomycetes bacterium]|nr:hypothetical protein [Planctomycetota bacterium]
MEPVIEGAPRSGAKRVVKWVAVGFLALVVLLAVVVFVFPSALANAGKGFAERAFAERFQGRVALGELELSWTGPQTVRSLEIFDPSGAKIVSASVTAPSIRQLLNGKQLGRARVEFEADLSADDAGVTNLERALAPREAKTPGTSKPDEPSDWRAQVRDLELQLDVVGRRVAWSDARTRAAGRPIVLSNLVVGAKLEHGERATVSLAADLQDDHPRKLALDAKVSHPFAAPGAAEPPRLELSADLEELPTGLIDGLAGLGGKLTRVLGPAVTVVASGSGDAKTGSLAFTLEGERAKASGELALEDGVLRGVKPRAFEARVAVDEPLLRDFVTPMLPPGLALERVGDSAVVVAVDDFTLELADVLDAAARGSDVVGAGVASTKAKLRVELGGWRVRRGAPAAPLELATNDVVLAANLGREGSRSPATVDLELAFAGSADRARVHVELADALQALAVATGGALDGASWRLELPSVPRELLASAGAPATDGLVVKGQGRIALTARAMPGPFAAADLARLVADAELSIDAKSVTVTPELALGATHATVKLGQGPDFDVDVAATMVLDGGAQSTVSLVAAVPGGIAGLLDGSLPPSNVKLVAKDLPVALADRFSGDAYALAKRLGASANVELDAQGDLDRATADVTFTSAHAELTADLAIADRKLTLGQSGLHGELDVDSATVAELAGPSLPVGASLAPSGGAQRAKIDVTRLAVGLDAWMPKTPGQPLDLATALAATDAAVQVALGDWRWSDASLVAAKQSVDVRQLAVAIDIAGRPGGAPAKLAFSALLGDASDTPLAAKGEVANVVELLELRDKRRLAPVSFVLTVPKVSIALVEAYTGSLEGRFGDRLGLTLDARAEWPSGAPVKTRLDVELSAAETTHAVIDASLADPFAALDKGALPEATVVVDVDRPALALSFVPPEYRELASEALGARFGLKAANRASSGATQSFSVALDAPGAKLDLAGVLDGRTFRATGKDRFVASLPLHGKTLAPLLKKYLPAGVEVALITDGEAVSFEASELELPLDAWLPAPGAEPEALSVALDRARAKLAVTLPTLRVRAPAVTANGTPVDVTLRGLQLAGVEFAPGKLVGAKVSGQLDATPPGSLVLAVVGEHPFGLLDDRGGALKPKLTLDGDLKQIPTALVDALAAQDGLIVDVLGAGADVKLHGTWPPEGADALTAELHSPNADFKVQANAKDGVLTSSGEQGLDASMIVTPLFGQRVVGSLVPLIADVRQVEGSKRAVLSGRNFSLPMSGDLRQLNGEITFDPGALEYRFLPGLSELFGDGAAKGMSSAKLEPVHVQITKGVARYDRLVIPLGKNPIVFKGSFDLVDRAYKLETEIPLSMLGSSVAKQLEGAASFLEPDTKIPIEIRGNSAKPKIRIADSFLKKVLEDAAGRALGKGLDDLLGGDKKKKKKKDG